MRWSAVVAISFSSLLIGGCLLFDPFGKRLQRLQSQAALMGERVDQLEFRGGYGPLVTGGSTMIDEPIAMDGSVSSLVARPRLTAVPSPASGRLPSVPINGRQAMEKLGRGIINLITGWVEVPKRMDETNKRYGLGPALTIGLLRGLGQGFVRTAAGAYEIVTFPFPAPPGYAPIMRPEYVFTSEDADVSRKSSQERGE